MHYNRIAELQNMKKYFVLFVVLFSSLCCFSLYSQEKRAETPVETEETPLPEMTIVENILYVKNAPVGAKIEILTIVGSKVKELKVRSRTDSYALNLPRAIYIFKLEGTVRKFVVK